MKLCMCSQFHPGARAATQRAPHGQGCRKEAVCRMTRLSATEWERKEQLRPCGQRWRWGYVLVLVLVRWWWRVFWCMDRWSPRRTYRAMVGLVAPAAALLGAEREEAPAHVLEAGVVLVRVNLAGRAPMVQIGLMKGVSRQGWVG